MYPREMRNGFLHLKMESRSGGSLFEGLSSRCNW
jgi:hypothetical protein